MHSLPLRRESLCGPGVRVLNLGGFGNPDVLRVAMQGGESVVVKDYAPRSLPVRLLARWLVRRERRLLSRLSQIPGVPAVGPRIDALAFAMEWIDAEPLRRRYHAGAISPAFFAGLERILLGLASRGVIYTDLRSPSNVLITRDGQPVLVDLSSAVRLPLPGLFARWLDARALRKLRRRFEREIAEDPGGEREAPDSDKATAVAQELGRPMHLHTPGGRIRVWDAGALGDPVPIAILPDAGVPAEALGRLLEAAVRRGRRAVVIELPGFNGTRAVLSDMHPERVATELERMLVLLRLPRVDLLAEGWAGLIARCLAARAQARVRSLVLLDTPVDMLEGTFLDRVLDARSNPRGLLRELRSRAERSPADVGLRTALEAVDVTMLQSAYLAVPIEAVAASEGSGWKLIGLPEPLVPWTILPGTASLSPSEGHSSPPLPADMILDQLGDPAV